MKVTVELSEKEMRDVCRYTGEKKKGPAIRKMIVGGLMMKRRLEMTEKFLTGEWSVDLPSYEEMKAQALRKDPWNA